MKHFQSMTEAALSAACDSYDADYCMNDLTADADDERAVTIYFRHNSADLSCMNDHGSLDGGFEREVSGVVIGDGLRVVLDREQAVETFGLSLVSRLESLV